MTTECSHASLEHSSWLLKAGRTSPKTKPWAAARAETATALFRLPVSQGGSAQDLYIRMNNALNYTAERGTETKLIGSGWDMYNLLMTPGNLGGTVEPDLLARDAAGALWLYQVKPDGTVITRVQVGASGWDGMDVLAGYGDYTGDGKSDLLARTPAGALYLYPGTGNAVTDAVFGTRIGVGVGWSMYKTLVSTGDNNGDGKADLIASDAAGALWPGERYCLRRGR